MIQRLAAYFQQGCKGEAPLRVGMELEQFLVNRERRSASFYGENGVESVLRELRGLYPDETRSQGHTIGLTRSDCSVTLEPGAQIECSLPPRSSLSELLHAYERYAGELALVLRQKGLSLCPQAYHPRTRIDELPLLPKFRYACMYNYFTCVGGHGHYMMKGSASTQVAIDYRDEADFSRKMAAACRLTPLLWLYAENAPDYEGAPYSGHLLRAGIWADVDPARCGFPPRAFEGMTFRDYANWLCDVPTIVFPSSAEVGVSVWEPGTVPEDGCFDPESGLRFTGKRTAPALCGEHDLTDAEAAHLAGMVFPHVRLRNYLELRMGDSLPFGRALGYAALVKGLFYSDRNLERVEHAFGQLGAEEAASLLLRMQTEGGDAVLAGTSAREWLERLTGWAAAALSPEERQYLA